MKKFLALLIIFGTFLYATQLPFVGTRHTKKNDQSVKILKDGHIEIFDTSTYDGKLYKAFFGKYTKAGMVDEVGMTWFVTSTQLCFSFRGGDVCQKLYK